MRFKKSMIVSVLILAVVGSFASSSVLGQTYPTYSFSLSPPSLTYCWYWGVMFNATQGQRFTVTWNETGGPPTSLDLYVVAPSATRESFPCDTGPVWLYYNSGAYGSAKWAAPSSGEYIVLVVNENYRSISGTLSIMAVNATVTATSIGYALARQPAPCLGPEC
jgi:hypothetical protein